MGYRVEGRSRPGPGSQRSGRAASRNLPTLGRFPTVRGIVVESRGVSGTSCQPYDRARLRNQLARPSSWNASKSLAHAHAHSHTHHRAINYEDTKAQSSVFPRRAPHATGHQSAPIARDSRRRQSYYSLLRLSRKPSKSARMLSSVLPLDSIRRRVSSDKWKNSIFFLCRASFSRTASATNCSAVIDFARASSISRSNVSGIVISAICHLGQRSANATERCQRLHCSTQLLLVVTIREIGELLLFLGLVVRSAANDYIRHVKRVASSPATPREPQVQAPSDEPRNTNARRQ